MDYQQQDSQEFLRFLLDGMSEDLCRKQPAQPPQHQSDASPIQKSSSAHSRSLHNQIAMPSVTSATSSGSGGNPVKAGGTILPILPQHGAAAHSASASSTESSPNSNASLSPGGFEAQEVGQTKPGHLTQKLRAETRAMRDTPFQQMHSHQAHSPYNQKPGGPTLNRMNARSDMVSAFAASSDMREEDSDDSTIVQIQSHPTAKAKLLADIRLSKKLNSQLDNGKNVQQQVIFSQTESFQIKFCMLNLRLKSMINCRLRSSQ